MKGRAILIDMPTGRGIQAALLKDGRLEDLLLPSSEGDDTPLPGEIYWAKVDRVVPNMGSAFVSLTKKHMGFLRETKGLKAGAGVLVQVVSYPEPGKATPVTSRLLYKHRHLILTPDNPGINVSRQIRDEDEKARLKQLVSNWSPDLSPSGSGTRDTQWYLDHLANSGVIIRTAAEGASASTIATELQHLLAMTEPAETASQQTAPRAVSMAAHGAMNGQMIDWFGPADIQVIVTATAAPIIKTWLDRGDPDGPIALQIHDGPDLFEDFGVWEEIDPLRQPRVALPSGAWMAIETTRAMVTVDVNTGDQFTGGAAMTANIEAARELPRQLRLRGLGGQVIVDFAPIKKTHRKKIEETLKSAFRKDPVATTLAGWTPLGNFELQRKRERCPLA